MLPLAGSWEPGETWETWGDVGRPGETWGDVGRPGEGREEAAGDRAPTGHRGGMRLASSLLATCRLPWAEGG